MNTWTKSIVAGVIATGLIFFAVNSLLRKGKNSTSQLFRAHYIAQVHPADAAGRSQADIQRTAAAIIKKRFLTAGFTCTVQAGSGRTLDIMAGHISDTTLAEQLITGNGKVEFREVYTINEMTGIVEADKIISKYLPAKKIKPAALPQPADTSDPGALKKITLADDPEEELPFVGIASLVMFMQPYQEVSGSMQYQPCIGMVRVSDTAIVNKILHDPELAAALPHDALFCYGPGNAGTKEEKRLCIYAIRARRSNWINELGNEDIKNAAAGLEKGRNEVMLQFNAAGTRKWARLTADNTGRSLAILVNGIVISAPIVTGVIEGGNAVISGSFTPPEARALAAQLSISEHMPAQLAVISREITAQNTGISARILLLTVLTFVITAGLAFLIFNSLKNRQNHLSKTGSKAL